MDRPEKQYESDSQKSLPRHKGNYIYVQGFNDCYDAHSPYIEHLEGQIEELVEALEILYEQINMYYIGVNFQERPFVNKVKNLILKHRKRE